MTLLTDLVGAIGAGLVHGRAQADHASVEVTARYRAEPLLREARIPRMTLSEVSVEIAFITNIVEPGRVDILVTARELASAEPQRLSVLALKFAGDDLDPPPFP